MRMRWPTVPEERMLEVRSRARRWRQSGLITEDGIASLAGLGPVWKRSGRFARVAFFLLGLLCVGAFYGLQAVADFGPRGWLTAIVSVAIAEILINRHAFLRTGVEEALYLGGLYGFVFGLPGPARNEGLLLFAAVTLVAGVRLRNALFAAGSVGLVLVYAATEWKTSGVAWLALVVGIAAAIVSARKIERPSFDRALGWLTVGAPALAAIVYYVSESDRLLMGAAVAIVVLGFIGGRWREHAPLVASLLLGALVVTELTRKGEWPLRVTLLVWGLAIGMVALVIERLLRGRRTGLTSRKLLDDPESGLLEIAATITITPVKPAAAPEPGFEPGGGEFGGGGASGEY